MSKLYYRTVRKEGVSKLTHPHFFVDLTSAAFRCKPEYRRQRKARGRLQRQRRVMPGTQQIHQADAYLKSVMMMVWCLRNNNYRK